MDLGIETITPEMAKKYLMFNTSNRALRKSLVSMYAKDMREGNWKLTHQGIAFNCDGTLLDGQHRLSAIIEAGVPVQMMVARGVERECQIAMDDHAKRNAGDALSLARNESITQSDVAVMRAVVELPSGRNRRSMLTKQELNNVVDLLKEPMRFVSQYMASTEKGITSAPVKSAIVLAWFYVDDLERLGLFCGVLTGRILPDGTGDRAALTLREWLLRNGIMSSSMRLDGFKKTQRSIVAFMKRQDISKIYGTSVSYPWPLVDPVRR